MGCYITLEVEKKTDTGHEFIACDLLALDQQRYRMFGFLAGVRNYSAITPISPPRGLPLDACETLRSMFDDDDNISSKSWLSVDELTNYDYTQVIEDRRCAVDGDESCTCRQGSGVKMTLREFLGDEFFKDLETLKAAGADRIVFGFD